MDTLPDDLVLLIFFHLAETEQRLGREYWLPLEYRFCRLLLVNKRWNRLHKTLCGGFIRGDEFFGISIGITSDTDYTHGCKDNVHIFGCTTYNITLGSTKRTGVKDGIGWMKAQREHDEYYLMKGLKKTSSMLPS
jgi:hypothetical protein